MGTSIRHDPGSSEAQVVQSQDHQVPDQGDSLPGRLSRSLRAPGVTRFSPRDPRRRPSTRGVGPSSVTRDNAAARGDKRVSGRMSTIPGWHPNERKSSVMPAQRGWTQRAAARMPIDALVRIRFADQEEFVDVVAANISRTGMFVRTQEPHLAGSRLRFELILGADSASIKGAGEVVWVRRGELYAVLPAGMGIRFRRLDQASRDIISRLVEPPVRRGRRPAVPSGE